MQIRNITKDDIESVSNLYNDLVYFIQAETKDAYFDFDKLTTDGISSHLKNVIDDANIKIIVAEEDKEIAGFITGEIHNCFLPVSTVKKIGYISGAFLKENFRNKGIMKKMIEEIELFFKGKGINFIELHVISNNYEAKKVWEKLGFKTFREQMRKKI